MRAEIVFGDVEAFYKQFSFMKNAIAVIETRFAGAQGFDLRSGHHHAGNICAFKEIVVGGLSVGDLQVVIFFAKILI